MQTTHATLHSSRIVKRSPFYYGWIVWIVATIGLLASSPGQTFSVSLFIDHFIADFHLDRTTVSTLFGIGTFIGALSLTWVGRQIDKRGNRTITVIASILFATALIGVAHVTGKITLLFGFIAIRGLGQGALGLSSSTTIAQWFQRRRGRMMSISMVIWALFQSRYVPFIEHLLAGHDWREIWMLMGVIVILTIPLLTWLFVRDKPEDYGLLPDGLTNASPTLEVAALPDDEDCWTLREAMRTSIFWVFIVGRVLAPAWGTGLIFHQLSIFSQAGYGPEVAAQIFGYFSIISATVALGTGFVIDRYPPQRMVTMQLSALIIAMFTEMFLRSTVMLAVYAVAMGFVMSIGGVFDGAGWTKVFGRRYQGSIRGFAGTTIVTASALGPILFGLSYDKTGSYNTVMWAGIVLCTLPMLISIFVRQPVRSRYV